LYKNTLYWLKASFDATNQRGSAATFSMLRGGWAKAYPETTGYIIETFLDYYDFLGEKWLLDYSKNAADWLISIQHENGAFPGGTGEKGAPSVFNSGMILFGLVSIFEKTKDEKYRKAIEKATDWLISILEKDGSWQQSAYVEGFVPSYYTRVIWAVLKANTILQNADIQLLMQKSLNFYKQKVNTNFSVQDWAFEPQKTAFTHTIAYTQRGFLEAGILLKDEKSITIAKNISLKINELYEKNGKIAGAYDESWNGDFSFRCNTGNAQLALNSAKIYEYSKESFYLDFAEKIFESVKNEPSTLPFSFYRGAIAGSSPIFGKYMKFSYPNWAAKFWLDAFLVISKSKL
jgi:uncharacterized protein YyaL (SSP411 family)